MIVRIKALNDGTYNLILKRDDGRDIILMKGINSKKQAILACKVLNDMDTTSIIINIAAKFMQCVPNIIIK